MCGRYVRRSSKQKIDEWFHVDEDLANLPMPDADTISLRRHRSPSSGKAERRANGRWCWHVGA
jgi:hypothetical protein